MLDGTDGAAHQIVRVECFRSALVTLLVFGIRKQRKARDRELCRALRGTNRFVDRESLDAGHGGDGGAYSFALDQEQRPDQVVGGKNMLAHQSSGPFGAAVTARPNGEIKPLSARVAAHRNRADPFNRPA